MKSRVHPKDLAKSYTAFQTVRHRFNIYVTEMSRLCFSRLRIRSDKLTWKSNPIRLGQNW